jgi:sRNA-binding carbon storage regulator CsrA
MEQRKIGALALTLKAGDSFTIGNEILIHVEKYSSTQIRILVKAPKDLGVERFHTVGELCPQPRCKK